MFENTKPPAIPKAASSLMQDLQESESLEIGIIADGEHVEVLPLRAIEWSELTARLNAARDLRHLLREDVCGQSTSTGVGFADAAAQFFRTSEDDERGVNPTALEGCKASSGKYQNVKSEGPLNTPFVNQDSADGGSQVRAEPGDAREEQ